MSLEDRLDRWGRGWRGPVLAAVVALVASLPGLIALPPLDRDEARFAQASAQMLESGDYVSIRFQGAPRFKKPVGIHWLQAAAVAAVSQVEDRRIWAWRLPSLIGAMVAAAACAWGAAAFLKPGPSLLAGALLGSSFLLSTEGAIAATDAALAGAVTLALAALGRLYLAHRGGPAASWRVKALFWAALSLSVLVKGPIGPLVAGLTMVTLAAWDRRVDWLRTLGWGWGLIALAAAVGPWAMAITVATDGAFWSGALGGDLAPKLAGGQEGHGAPPGFYAASLPVLLFPATLLLPAGLIAGWGRRAESPARFAIAWLVPAWLVFEAIPTKLIHYPLPLYGALAWLMALALERPAGRWSRGSGAALLLAAGVSLAGAGVIAAVRLGGGAALAWSLLAAVLIAGAGGAGAVLLLRKRPRRAVAVAVVLGVAGHAVLAGGEAPSLSALWLSSRAARVLAASGADPRQGLVSGPVSVAGYEEPSLVFLLGTDTQLASAGQAAAAVSEGRPAIVEGRADPAFRQGLAFLGARARLTGEAEGLDYSNGRRDILRIYQPLRGKPGPRP